MRVSLGAMLVKMHDGILLAVDAVAQPSPTLRCLIEKHQRKLTSTTLTANKSLTSLFFAPTMNLIFFFHSLIGE